ncbi:hypothetical protein RSA31_21975 [Pantoea dispersa]|nr:hypothetical protein RSA31_21975 [Pantoea dispersa]
MALIVKSQHYRRIERMHVSAKQVAGMVQTKLHMILQRRHTRMPGEEANKMIFAHPRQLREHLQLRFYAEVLL